MNKILKVLAVSSLSVAPLATGVQAQALPGLNLANLAQVCRVTPQACASRVRALIASLRAQGATPAQLDNAIAQISGTLVEIASDTVAAQAPVAGNASSNTLSAIGDALVVASENSSDPLQQDTIAEVADAVIFGDAEELSNLSDGVFASGT